MTSGGHLYPLPRAPEPSLDVRRLQHQSSWNKNQNSLCKVEPGRDNRGGGALWTELRCSFHAAQNVVIRRDVLTKHESKMGCWEEQHHR